MSATKDKPSDTSAPSEKAAPPTQTDIERLDAWVQDVRKRVDPQEPPKMLTVAAGASVTPFPAPKVGLAERLLAMQWELSKVPPEAVHPHHGFNYHSIQAVENHVNRLSAIYRVRIKPSRKDSIVVDGGVRLLLSFDAYCWDTDEHETWEWEDDGEDLTKAGSYTQKYALMKFFHMGDGQDPDAEAARGKPQRTRQASSSSARTPAPTNGGGAAVDANVKDGLYLLAKTLPPTAGWAFKDDGTNIKIDAMLKSKMDPGNVRALLVEAHKKAHGENCEHVAPPAADEDKVPHAADENEQAPA